MDIGLSVFELAPELEHKQLLCCTMTFELIYRHCKTCYCQNLVFNNFSQFEHINCIMFQQFGHMLLTKLLRDEEETHLMHCIQSLKLIDTLKNANILTENANCVENSYNCKRCGIDATISSGNNRISWVIQNIHLTGFKNKSLSHLTTLCDHSCFTTSCISVLFGQ